MKEYNKTLKLSYWLIERGDFDAVIGTEMPKRRDAIYLNEPERNVEAVRGRLWSDPNASMEG